MSNNQPTLIQQETIRSTKAAMVKEVARELTMRRNVWERDRRRESEAERRGDPVQIIFKKDDHNEAYRILVEIKCLLDILDEKTLQRIRESSRPPQMLF